MIWKKKQFASLRSVLRSKDDRQYSSGKLDWWRRIAGTLWSCLACCLPPVEKFATIALTPWAVRTSWVTSRRFVSHLDRCWIPKTSSLQKLEPHLIVTWYLSWSSAFLPWKVSRRWAHGSSHSISTLGKTVSRQEKGQKGEQATLWCSTTTKPVIFRDLTFTWSATFATAAFLRDLGREWHVPPPPSFSPDCCYLITGLLSDGLVCYPMYGDSNLSRWHHSDAPSSEKETIKSSSGGDIRHLCQAVLGQ